MMDIDRKIDMNPVIGRTEVEQLHKIFKLCGSPSEDYWRKSKLPHATIFKPQNPYKRCVGETFKDFPAPALTLIETLLSIDPADRQSAKFALNSEFFSSKPLPRDPLSLPKYPPSKEFDAKLRDEEARRRQSQRLELKRKGTRESRAIPAPNANAELPSSMLKRQSQSNSKSRSEKFNPNAEEVASGFPMDPPRPTQALEARFDSQFQHPKRASHSGPLVQRAAWAKTGKSRDEAPKISAGTDVPIMPGHVASRRSMLTDEQRAQAEVHKLMCRFPGYLKEPSEALAQKYYPQDVPGSYKKDDAKDSSKDPILIGFGSKGHKIHYSGPLLVPSGDVDQMLKEHDRHIQEAVRRARLDKSKIRNTQDEVGVP